MVRYLFDILSNNRIQKRIISGDRFPGERILVFGLCLSDNLKWVSRIDTLLEADFRSPATNFRFRCPYGSDKPKKGLPLPPVTMLWAPMHPGRVYRRRGPSSSPPGHPASDTSRCCCYLVRGRTSKASSLPYLHGDMIATLGR